MRTRATSRAAVFAAVLALAAWTAGWSVHAVHAARAAQWPGLSEICSAAGTSAPQPRPSSQCPVCAQFLAAAAPQQALAAPAGLLVAATHEAVVPRESLPHARMPRFAGGPRAPPSLRA